MGKIPGYTTTADLPESLQGKYELTEPLEGGPRFDLPNYRQYGIDFSQLTENQAETLIKRRWPYLRRVEPPVVPNEFTESAPPSATSRRARKLSDAPEDAPEGDE